MKKLNKTQAIAAKCKECIYDPGSPGTWKAQVEECTSYSCPLYSHRPKSAKRKGAEAPSSS